MSIISAPTAAHAAEVVPSEPLNEIVAKVRAGEAPFENIEVKFHFEMVAADVDPALIAARKDPKRFPVKNNVLGGGRILFEEWTAHYVAQGSLFRLERHGYNISDSNRIPRVSRDLIDAWDGEKQVRIEQNAVANIFHVRRPGREAFRPHLLLMRRGRAFAPLSLMLSGADAIRATEFKEQVGPAGLVVVRPAGSEVYDHLPCQKVILEFYGSKGRRRSSRFDLWLATTRNYIPARVVGYSIYSEKLPAGEGRVVRWQEVKPGIWCPAETTLTTYNDQQLLRHQIQKASETEHYFLDSIAFDPKYPKAYFSDVKIPKGVSVYDVQPDHRRGNR